MPRIIRFIPLFLLAVALTGCGSSGDLSPENVKKVKLGMTLPEVETIIGCKPSQPSQSDLDAINKWKRGAPLQMQQGKTLYLWQQGHTLFHVLIDDKTGKVTTLGRYSGS